MNILQDMNVLQICIYKFDVLCNTKGMKKYNVWIRSKPGFYAQYDGKVTVFADNDDEAIEKALLKLKRGAFQDRDNSMWLVERVERVMS